MIKNKISALFKGDQRTVLLLKNIIGSFVIKGWNCVVQLLLVPITLNCLTQYEYGIWLTINSILIWIDSFDIGLGNGLRNQLTQSLAVGDKEKGRRQVSTTFMMLSIIIVPVVLCLLGVIHCADCYSFLNVDKGKIPNLEGVLMVSVAMVGATFVLKVIGNVYLALQLPAVNNLIVAMGQTIALIGIFALSLFQSVSLLQVALIYTASPLLVYLLSYPITFTRYAYLRPSLHLFDKQELGGLFGLGMKFFLVQMSGMVIFATSNILISRLFSPLEVAPYQIASRYFGLTNILFTLISAPLWSATTDAYTKGDWQWIKTIMKKMRLVIFSLCGVLLVMFLLSDQAYHLWVGSKVAVPVALSGAMAVYLSVILYGTCYSNMLCGFGKIRLLTIVSVIQACIYIPLAVYLSGVFGVIGIVYALIFTTSISAVTNKVQFEKICAHTAKGIFNK